MLRESHDQARPRAARRHLFDVDDRVGALCAPRDRHPHAPRSGAPSPSATPPGPDARAKITDDYAALVASDQGGIVVGDFTRASGPGGVAEGDGAADAGRAGADGGTAECANTVIDIKQVAPSSAARVILMMTFP